MRKMLLVAFIMILIFVSSVVGVGLYNEYMIANTGRIPLSFDYIVAEMIAEINETEIYNTVYRLQNFTTRAYGYSGNTLAAEYIYNRLKTISGFTVEYQGSYKNVIATLPGTDSTSSQIYVVGAHYDSISSDPSNAPGATDNGGGVAIVLEFARIMSQYRFEHTLKFALWNKEETGDVSSKGSMDFVKWASSTHLNISLYLNYDSSCYDPDNRFVLDIMYNGKSQWVSDMMTEYNTLYSIGLNLTYNAHTCTSDHSSFWSYGYTAITTHAETHGSMYHTPFDTIDKISTSYARKNGQLGMSVLAKLAETQGTSPDTKPPLISILSPENKTYSTHDIYLAFTIDEAVEWIGCSVDKQANQSLTENTALLTLANGWHRVTLYANDTSGNMGMSTVYFIVDTTPPLVNAGDDQTVNEDALVTFDGSASTDENDVATYTWTFTDLTSRTLNGKNATYTFATPGTYTVTLEVADPAGNTATDTVTITVLDVTDPVANAGSDRTVNEDVSTILDGSASADNVGITGYTWTFTGATAEALTGEKPAYTFTNPSVYAITLNVTDAAGNWAIDTVVITVLDVTNPVANAGQDQTVNVGETITFDAGSSADNVGIVSYQWDFGDRTTTIGKTTTYTYTSSGTHTVTLTAKDAANNSDTDTLTVMVLSAQPPPAEDSLRWVFGAIAIIAVATAATLLWKRPK